MPFLSTGSIDNDPMLIKLLGELRSALKAGNLNTGLTKTFRSKLEEIISLHSLGLDPKGSVTHPDDYIKGIVNQINRLPDQQLYAGLAIICKDLLSDSNKYSSLKNQDLMTIIEEFFKEEQTESPSSELLTEEPVYRTSGSTGNAIKLGWYNGEISSLLLDNSICHPWTILPGQKLFEKFKLKFKGFICEGPDSPYEKSKKNTEGDITTTLVGALLSKCPPVNSFWVPVLAYFAVLLIKTGLKVYCEGEQVPEIPKGIEASDGPEIPLKI
jgi:hypothetical protein